MCRVLKMWNIGKFWKINTSWTVFNATTKISAGVDNKWYDSYLKKIYIKGTSWEEGIIGSKKD